MTVLFLPGFGYLHFKGNNANTPPHSIAPVFQIRHLVGICHKQGNIVSSEVIAIDRPGFGRLTTDKTLQRVTILTKLQRLYFRTVVQPLAIDESDILFLSFQ